MNFFFSIQIFWLCLPHQVSIMGHITYLTHSFFISKEPAASGEANSNIIRASTFFHICPRSPVFYHSYQRTHERSADKATTIHVYVHHWVLSVTHSPLGNWEAAAFPLTSSPSHCLPRVYANCEACKDITLQPTILLPADIQNIRWSTKNFLSD